MTTRHPGPAIGIDLGTTYSCVAVWRSGRVEIISNEQGNRTTPSFVSFNDTERLIGEGAKNQIAMNPTNTVFDVKRLIGRRYIDAMVQVDMKAWPFKIVEGQSGKPMIVVTHKDAEKRFSAEEISSMVLVKLKEVADAYLNADVKSAVITIPAYFDDLQRQATKDAARLAGLDVLRLLSEPTAAAIAYGLDERDDINGKMNVLIFDLGGGTFDVSLVAIEKGRLEVKAVGGDTHLGGEDFDNRIVKYLVEEFSKKYGKDISRNPRAMGRLRVASEKAKRTLSSSTRTTIDIDCLYDGVDFSINLTRAKFEELNMDFFNKCMETVQRCLDDAKFDKTMVDEVVLVGGSTRIPKVQRMLEDFFDGMDLCKKINPDESIAYGAAVLAAKMSGKGNQIVRDLVLSDVTPLSLGVESFGDFMTVLIPRNTPIPVTKESIRQSVVDNQSSFLFKVYQGERRRSTDNILLGEFELSNLPLAPRGLTKVKVCFNIDVNGIFQVSVEELTTGQKNTITITNDKGSLTKEEMDKMLEDADSYKVSDQEYKKNLDDYNVLEDYIDVIQSKMMDKNIRKRLSKEDLKDMDDVVQMVRQWLEINKLADTTAITEVMKEVVLVCNSRLGRFM